MSTKKAKALKKNYSDGYLTLFVTVLTVFSIIMIASANITSSENVVTNVFMAVLKQGIFMVLGYIGYFICRYMFSFALVRKYISSIIMIEFVLLLATRLFGAVGGAYAWIRLPFDVTIQPSEFAKIIIILVVANFMCDIKNKKIKEPWILTKTPVMLTMIWAAIIIVYQSDFGSGFAFTAISCIVFLIPSHKSLGKHQRIIIALMCLVVVATLFLMSKPFEEFLLSDGIQMWLNSGQGIAKVFNRISYQFYRFVSAGDPLWDRFGYSQELLNSLLGIARGNLQGVGLGNSIQKFGYLASADADYIFPVIVEELGLIGIGLVFIPYIAIYFILIRYALKVKTEKEKVVLLGTVAYLFVHMFLNIGGVSALIPLTGVPLLLISRGASSRIAVMAAFGICQNIIHNYNKEKAENENNSW